MFAMVATMRGYLIIAALAACVCAGRVTVPATASETLFNQVVEMIRPSPRLSLPACQNSDPLGVARVMPVGTQGGGAVGRKSYPQTLPLADREVVLTFDDGPWPGTTRAVLDALAAECTHATFFLVGRRVEENPAIARAVRDAGHTIATHSMTHPNLSHLAQPKAEMDISRGIQAVQDAVGEDRVAPFFRFPGFADTPTLVSWLGLQDIGTFGTDIWASDWNFMSPGDQLDLVLHRLDQRGRGMILFHDTKAQTAKMLPAFLRTLKKRGYRVVAMVPGPGPMETAR